MQQGTVMSFDARHDQDRIRLGSTFTVEAIFEKRGFAIVRSAA